MGLALVIIGLLMVITGARGTYAQFASQVSSDFQSQGNSPGFGIWLLAIGGVGALGYIPEIRIISRYLMALILVVIFLQNKGFFAQFQSALQSGPKMPNALSQNSGNVPTASNPSGGPVLNLGPLGTINLNPIDPNGPIGKVWHSITGG